MKTAIDAIEIANFSYGEKRNYYKAEEIEEAINTIHTLNPTAVTYIEGDYLELSPPSTVLSELFL